MRGRIRKDDIVRLRRRRKLSKKKASLPEFRKRIYSALVIVLLLIIIEPFVYRWTTNENRGGHRQAENKYVEEMNEYSFFLVCDKDATGRLAGIILFYVNPGESVISLYFPPDSYIHNSSGAPVILGDIIKNNRIKKIFPQLSGKIYVVTAYKKSLVMLVDLLKGIVLSLPKDWVYENKKQNIFYHIPGGESRLGGDKITQYLLFPDRRTTAIERTRTLITSLVKSFSDEESSTRDFILKQVYRNTVTSLAENDFIHTVKLMFSSGKKHLYITGAPGNKSRVRRRRMFLVDKIKLYRLLGKKIVNRELNQSDDFSQPMIDIGIVHLMKLGILNASEREGVDEYIKNFLDRIKNLEVEKIYSSEKLFEETTILQCSEEDYPVGKEIIRIIGGGKIEKTTKNHERYDMILTVGDDFGK